MILLPRRKATAFLAAAALAVMGLAGRPALALDVEVAKTFVAKAIDDTLSTYAGKTLSGDQRAAKLRDTIGRFADPALTGRDILGRYWAKATPDEQRRFATTLVDYVVATWNESLSDIDANVRIEVTAAEPQGDRVLVHSVATQPNELPNTVDWLVAADTAGRLVAADVSVGGVSLVNTMKADFTSVLRANSGQMEGLLAAMKKKIDAQPK